MYLAALLLASCSAAAPATTVLVTGASGQTGSILYKLLRATPGSVRAMVRNTTKARAALGCDKCDPSEGIYTGDVTNVTTLTAAFAVRL